MEGRHQKRKIVSIIDIIKNIIILDIGQTYEALTQTRTPYTTLVIICKNELIECNQILVSCWRPDTCRTSDMP